MTAADPTGDSGSTRSSATGDSAATTGSGAEVTLVVADDQTVVREGLRSLLGLLPGMRVLATAASAEEALELVAAHDPDVLLTDLRMPGIGGVAGIRQLRESGSRTAAVALTTFDDEATILSAVDAGALGFLNKDADPESISAAVRAAAAGRSLLDARALAALVSRAAGGPPTGSLLGAGPTEGGSHRAGTSGRSEATSAAAGIPTPAAFAASGGAPEPGPDGLTVRELEVLRLVAAGRSNQQIARELFVSVATVKTHINHLLAKTRCSGRADLVRFAYDHRLTG